MKKKSILILLLLISPMSLFCQNVFIDLCNKALEHNLQVQTARLNAEKNKKQHQLLFTQYLPMIELNSEISYEESKFNLEYPESAGVSGTITQRFPWGAWMVAKPGFYYIKKDDNDKNEYESLVRLSVELSQSLSPAFLHFGQANAELNLPKIYRKQSDNSLLYEEYSLLDSMLSLIMRIRRNERNLKLAQSNLDLIQKRFKVTEELMTSRSLNQINFYNERQNLFNAKNNLENSMDTRNQLMNELQQITGISLNEDEKIILIEELCSLENYFLDFQWYFGFWNFYYSKNLRLQQSEIKLERIKSEFNLAKQDFAPRLILAADWNYDKIDGHSVQASIGFDISNLWNSEKLRLKKEYKKESGIALEEKLQGEKLLEEVTHNYEKALERCMVENQNLEIELKDMEQFYNDYSKLYSLKQCSELDFLQAKNAWLQTVYEFENNTEILNYYKLLLKVDLSQ